MKENALEKKLPADLREKGQYGLVFGVIAIMLFAAGFPIFLLFFVGALTFFIWKIFSSEGRHETRRIFEFYLSANEILREDDRRWYGFEIMETIRRGENILNSMKAAPPLVYFALGALYQKVDDHGSAVKYLSHISEEESSPESAIVFPTKELREYVHMLRKIERAPAEAPLTSAAIRSLERARKNKGKKLLEYSRSQLTNTAPQLHPSQKNLESVVDAPNHHETENADIPTPALFHENGETPPKFVRSVVQNGKKTNTPQPDRKSISEVLHDIYE